MGVTAAVIGLGRMGSNTSLLTLSNTPPIWFPLSHVDALNAIQSIQLNGLSDIDLDMIAKARERHPTIPVFFGHEEMLKTIRPDIVGIATRSAGRYEIIRDCIKFGVKGIHVEKPMECSMLEVLKITNLIKEANIAFTFGTIRRYMAPYLRAKEIIQNGDIGEIKQIVINHGSDLLLWGHPHSVDMALFFTDNQKVLGVQARLIMNGRNSKSRVNCDPSVKMGYIEFENGISALITEDIGQSIKIVGTQGVIEILYNGSEIRLYKPSATRPYILEFENLNFDSGISGTKQAFLNLECAINKNYHTGTTTGEVEILHHILFLLAYSAQNRGAFIAMDELPIDFKVTGRFKGMYP